MPAGPLGRCEFRHPGIRHPEGRGQGVGRARHFAWSVGRRGRGRCVTRYRWLVAWLHGWRATGALYGTVAGLGLQSCRCPWVLVRPPSRPACFVQGAARAG